MNGKSELDHGTTAKRFSSTGFFKSVFGYFGGEAGIFRPGAHNFLKYTNYHDVIGEMLVTMLVKSASVFARFEAL
jgi:hypothetical protein